VAGHSNSRRATSSSSLSSSRRECSRDEQTTGSGHGLEAAPRKAWIHECGKYSLPHASAIVQREESPPPHPVHVRAGVLRAGAVVEPILHQRAQFQSVSKFPDAVGRGIFPTHTTRFEKRGIAPEVPAWDTAKCVQCNICASICPHATVHSPCHHPGGGEGRGDQPVGRAGSLSHAPCNVLFDRFRRSTRGEAHASRSHALTTGSSNRGITRSWLIAVHTWVSPPCTPLLAFAALALGTREEKRPAHQQAWT